MGTTAFARGALLLVLVIVSVLSSPPVQAEERTLPLSQIIEYSLQNNGGLKSFREQKGIRDAGKTRAGLLPNPSIEFEGSTGALTGNSAENNLSLGISQEFLLSGKRNKRLAVAERELEMYNWQLSDRERLLRDEVKSAFYDLILTEKRLAFSENFISINRQLLDVTRERLAAGDISELEMNLVKVELARSLGKRLEVERVLKQNRAKLHELMGLQPGESTKITGTLEQEILVTRSLADLKQLAHANRPDIKALQAEKNRGEADIMLAGAEGIPNLTVGLAVMRETTAIEIGGMENKDTAYTVGLKLSLPIPVFDRNQAGVRESQARRNSAGSRLSAIAGTVDREVETAYASFVNADTVLTMYRANILPQLEENLKLTQEAYRLGELGILAVIEEQKKFFEVNEGHLTALHERLATLSRLESATATDLSGGAQ
ncbi:MAG: RND transporter [Geobacteraceae bacterium GWC2_48_7]|nr:MAG: RND transporter [Geobacteraceae bacterium GWC2_48_7]